MFVNDKRAFGTKRRSDSISAQDEALLATLLADVDTQTEATHASEVDDDDDGFMQPVTSRFGDDATDSKGDMMELNALITKFARKP